MHRFFLVMCLAILGTPGTANELPPVPEGGLMVIHEGPCTDSVTLVEGYCVVSQDRQGNHYVIFAVEGEVQEIRQVVGDGFTVIWSRIPGVDA